jgi:hypothetical protein
VTTANAQSYGDAATLASGRTLTASVVNASVSFAGAGTVNAPLSVGAGATLSPGLSPGCLGSGDLSFTGTSKYAVELNGSAACTQYDQTSVSGTVTLASSTLNLTAGFTPAGGTQFTIIANDGSDPASGTFNGLPQGAAIVVNGKSFSISYTGGTGTDVVLTASGATAVRVAAFVARRGASGVVLTWRTGADAGIAGFNVWRGAMKVNPTLIPARGRLGGTTYRFVDPAPGPAAYRLETVGVDGSRIFARATRA